MVVDTDVLDMNFGVEKCIPRNVQPLELDLGSVAVKINHTIH